MYENAVVSLNEAIKLDPHLPEAHNSLGLTYSKVGNYRRALECYELAAEAIIDLAYRQLIKDDEKPFTSRVTTDGKSALVVDSGAFDRIESVLRANPMWAINRNNIGICLAAIGEKRRAKEMFEESIRFIPKGMKYDAPFLGLMDIANE